MIVVFAVRPCCPISAPVWHCGRQRGVGQENSSVGRWRQCAPQKGVKKENEYQAEFFRESDCRFEASNNQKTSGQKQEKYPKPNSRKCLQVKARHQKSRAVPSNPRSAGIFQSSKADIKNEGLASIKTLVQRQKENKWEKQGIFRPVCPCVKTGVSEAFRRF